MGVGNIHPAELRPHLQRYAKNHTLDGAGFDQLGEGGDSFLFLEPDCVLDLLVLG